MNVEFESIIQLIWRQCSMPIDAPVTGLHSFDGETAISEREQSSMKTNTRE
ncbi:MAG: hypothetical protein GY801_49455 [bacterium]|nr:hypothetical protein [bacterium]